MTTHSFCRRSGYRPGPVLFQIAILSVAAISFAARVQSDPFAEGVRATDPVSPQQQQSSFHLPEGFSIQLVAAEPDIHKPMNMAFDAKGRLWVTTSIEYPFAAPPERPGRDRIMIFEDFAPDGRARKVTEFAKGLNIPIGIYPFFSAEEGRPGTWKCIAWSIPNIWLFEDTNGDGAADRQEILYGPFDHTRDTHGNQASFRRGFDGWLYATHGFNNDSRVRGRDGNEVRLNSGNTYRMRLDGSRMEHHTWGQVNPFGLSFDPLGNLYSADCHSAPIYQLLRGGYYPSFGKPHDGLGFAPVLMEHSHGSTAISGIVYHADEHWPEEFRDNILIGNVMTSRINRDQISFAGTSPSAIELPDFLRTDDPWFRPVDLQWGPDGALYVADFYNRIIGHYEVPLTHPGRDRERGRLWRIVHEGQTGVRSVPDLTRASVQELIEELAAGNSTRRMLAAAQLTDRVGSRAIEPARRALQQSRDAHQRIQLLWILQRLGGLEARHLTAAAQDGQASVRVHAMRVLAETGAWSARHSKMGLAGLVDADPHVQRAAAEALGLNPRTEHIRPLLRLRHESPDLDAHLIHAVRIALRNQFLEPGSYDALGKLKLSEADARVVADVSVAVPSAEAGSYLLNHIQKHRENRENLNRYARHAARHVPFLEMDGLAVFARRNFADELDFQLGLFRSLQEGAAQRGLALTREMQAWGAELAERLLDGRIDWSNTPVPDASRTGNPWVLQRRASSDGDSNAEFISSLPPGGESLTGVLRSKTFPIPARLRFFVAGHDGFPEQSAQGRNFVRLREMSSQMVLRVAPAPRNDIAQLVDWDLEEHAGGTGYLEIVDGDSGAAYAWIAAGRFEPPVVTVPKVGPGQVQKHHQAAADLIGGLLLARLEPKLMGILTSRNSDLETQAAAARAVVALKPGDAMNALAGLLGDPALPPELRANILAVFASGTSPRAALTHVLSLAPYRMTLKVSQALAGTPSGSELLLELVRAGTVPARILLDGMTRQKLLAALPESGAREMGTLTQGQTPIAEEVQLLIEQQSRSFTLVTAQPLRGAESFAQACAACHQISGNGGLIGPQLDGIGNRGVERLLEDILDPNRNVDHAFRMHILTLTDGEIVSGLPRREEGELVVLADAAGREISIPKAQIKERHESELSLMPENYGEAFSSEQLHDLLGFLLLQKTTSP